MTVYGDYVYFQCQFWQYRSFGPFQDYSKVFSKFRVIPSFIKQEDQQQLSSQAEPTPKTPLRVQQKGLHVPSSLKISPYAGESLRYVSYCFKWIKCLEGSTITTVILPSYVSRRQHIIIPQTFVLNNYKTPSPNQPNC